MDNAHPGWPGFVRSSVGQVIEVGFDTFLCERFGKGSGGTGEASVATNIV